MHFLIHHHPRLIKTPSRHRLEAASDWTRRTVGRSRELRGIVSEHQHVVTLFTSSAGKVRAVKRLSEEARRRPATAGHVVHIYNQPVASVSPPAPFIRTDVLSQAQLQSMPLAAWLERRLQTTKMERNYSGYTRKIGYSLTVRSPWKRDVIVFKTFDDFAREQHLYRVECVV